MIPKPRMDREQRKAQIIRAVMPLFSVHGFDTVTSKDMAKAAGVSEGLIYKYFPQKSDIYYSVYTLLCSEMTSELDNLLKLTPCFQSLMAFFGKFVDHVFDDSLMPNKILPKLIMRSIIEDGEFAGYFFDIINAKLCPFISKCLDECKNENLISNKEFPNQFSFWFFHHLIVMFRFINRSDKTLVSYSQSNSEIKDELIRFGMRGMTFNEEAIARGIQMINSISMETERKAV